MPYPHAQQRSFSFPQFSLRDYFIGILALAIGFVIWAAPKGNWLDIPVFVLSFFSSLACCAKQFMPGVR
jgi:hypothetical protein